MANREHLDILAKGIDAWNAHLPKFDTRPDLIGADLSGANLVVADPTGADLRGADLSDAVLNGCSANTSNIRSIP